MYKNYIKPLIDFFFALLGLLLLSPIFILLSLLVWKKLGAPILFKQERPGKNGMPFYLYKFRSMTNDTDDLGNLLSNEKRLTKFGKKLRSTSLDELPSLLNVLKGDLSLVGPRPLRMRYLPYFSTKQNTRHTVRPGITGYAQVNGRSNLDWDTKLNMDVYYVENISLCLDIRILHKTFINVLFKKDTTPNNSNFEMPFDEYVKNKKNA
ncbi:sugar transferase [Marixanthomonas sp. SCSIO 43207]|uniref:sugar transferase n=1 Tax=Marixanthomonas sp. SCSIO 43207 TaxID=2779360 RepID=UPI001CAA3AA0|nr:sugar transferase [Marixanthomonas sp. SCSIO 43207]UAB80428.1 sugar transferase [Marixanthomonas sp. SCSIO 43207]